MTHTKSNRNRVIASVASFILILALLLTGTFAFVIPMQHRTNIFEGEGIQFDATLFDHFREADAVNWRRGETIDKTIYVVNTGENPTSHGPVFVRISLREFMELIPTLVFYWGVAANGDLFQVPHANMFGSSTSRDVDAALFMVETGSGAGNTSHVFVHIPSSVYDYDADEADVLAALQVIRPDITAQHELVFTTDFVSGVEGWFVISREGDIHGQYGRYMVADVTLDTNPANTTLVGSNTPRATNQQFGIHGTNGECNYDVHLWHNAVLTAVVNQLRVGGNLPASYTAQYRAWIQWLLGGRVVLLSEWENMTPAERLAAETTVVTAPAEHSQAPIGAGVWIIDDRSPTATPASASGVNGWIYWSRQLEVGYRTANFLENVTLLEQPSGAFNYKIHVTMEGVSRESLSRWTDLPPFIRDTFTPAAPTPDFEITVSNDDGDITVTVVPPGSNVTIDNDTIVITVPAPGIDGDDWVDTDLPPGWTYTVTPGNPGTVVITPPPGYTIGGTYPNITVTPPTTTYTLTLSTENVALANTANSTGTVTVTTNASGFTVGTLPAWLDYSITGNVVTFEALTANTNTGVRYVDVVISANPNATVRVTQLGTAEFMSVTPGSWAATVAGGSEDITVIANVTWNASITASTPATNWLTITNTTDGGFTLNATANPSINPRSATVTVTGTGISVPVEITVTQAAAAPHLSATPNLFNAPQAGGTHEFTIDTNVEWSPTRVGSSDTSWLTFISMSLVGDTTITLRTQPNTTTTTRTATFTLTSTHPDVADYVITITQPGVGAPPVLETVAGGTTPSTVVGNTPASSNSFWSEVCWDTWVVLGAEPRLGSVLLSDILVDTTMAGLTISSNDPRFSNSLFTIGYSPAISANSGEPAILFGWFPTHACFTPFGYDIDTAQIPIAVTLTRGGSSVDITLTANFFGTIVS